jgi:hypothetical protein
MLLLAGLLMSGMLFAEAAVLRHLQSVGIVLLVLHGIVVALLALGASQSDLNPLSNGHVYTS